MSVVTARTVHTLSRAYNELDALDQKIVNLAKAIAQQKIWNIQVWLGPGTSVTFGNIPHAPARGAANAALRLAMEQRNLLIEQIEQLGGKPPALPELPHYGIDLREPEPKQEMAVAIVGSLDVGLKAYGPFDDWSKANTFAVDAMNKNDDADIGVALSINPIPGISSD